MTTSARPKVSILIPVYNTAKYLDACMKSVREQTLKEIEIIAVNDASPDNAAEVLAKYAALDSRIKVVTHEKNGGILAARLSGIAAASGEFVICLDADDTLDKDIARAAYAKARKTGADMVHFKFDVRLGNGKKTPFARKVEKDLRPAKDSFIGEKVFEAAFVERRYRWNICGKMISHEVFSKAAAALPPGYYIMAEDFCFYTLMSFYSKHYEPLNKKGYNYVLNIGVSAYTAADRAGFERSCSVFTALNAVRGFLQKNGVFEKYEKAFRLQESLLLGDLLDRWYHRVLPADREYGFEFMVKNYDPLAIAAAMADAFTAPCEMEEVVNGIGNANGFFDHAALTPAGKCALIAIDREKTDVSSVQLTAAADANNWQIIPFVREQSAVSADIRALVNTLQAQKIDTVIIPEAILFTDLIWLLLSLKLSGFRTIVIPAGSYRNSYSNTIGRSSGNMLAIRFADAVGTWSVQEAEFYRFCGIRSAVLPVLSTEKITRTGDAGNLIYFGEAGNLNSALMTLGAVAKLHAGKIFTGELLLVSPALPEEAERKLKEWSRALGIAGKVRFMELNNAALQTELTKAAALITGDKAETASRVKFFSGITVIDGDPENCDMDKLAGKISAVLKNPESFSETPPSDNAASWQTLIDMLAQPAPQIQPGAEMLFERFKNDAALSLLYERYSIIPPRDGDSFYSFYSFFDRKLAGFFPPGSSRRHVLFAGLRYVMRKIFKKG